MKRTTVLKRMSDGKEERKAEDGGGRSGPRAVFSGRGRGGETQGGEHVGTMEGREETWARRQRGRERNTLVPGAPISSNSTF